MALGETILKITDYPVSYSAAFLLMNAANISPISQEAILYFLSAGIGATFFAIVDPVGRGLKVYTALVLRAHLRKFAKIEPILKTWNDVKGALNTNAIEAEKDRIVNIIYFLGIMILLMVLVQNDDFFSKYFEELYLENPSCDMFCSQNQVFFSIVIVSCIIGGIGGLKGAYIIDRTKTVATYQKCVNSPFVLDSTKNSLGDYIKLGDWETAKTWKEKIEKEFVTEQALQDKRRQNSREHVDKLLQEFYAFKTKCEQQNQKALISFFDREHEREEYFDIEKIFKKFSFFDSLIQHCYSSKDTSLYELFYALISKNKNMEHQIKNWIQIRTDGISNAINSLELQVTANNNGRIEGQNGQWINIKLLNTDFDRFIEYDREQLFLPEKIEDGELYEVRFFKSDPSIGVFNEAIAHLFKNNAEKLATELGDLAFKLRGIRVSAEFEQIKHIEDRLKEKTIEVITAHSLMAQPLDGYCKYCLNENFWSLQEIESKKNILKEIPDMVFDKTKYKNPWGKNKQKKGIV